MVDATQTTPAKADSKVATGSASSDDDEVEPAENTSPAAVKSSATISRSERIVDSDEDSFPSSSSEEVSITTETAATAVSKAQDSSSNDDSEAEDAVRDANASSLQSFGEGISRKITIKESEIAISKQAANTGQQQEESLGDDECDEEGNYAVDVDERSRLMAAALAAGISSDDSFGDDSDYGSPPAKLISTVPRIVRSSSEPTMKVVPPVPKVQDPNDFEPDDDSFSTLSDLESDSESSSYDDDESDEIIENRPTTNVRIPSKLNKVGHRGYAQGREDDLDDDLGPSDLSDYSNEEERKKMPKKYLSSASFSAISTSFKWSNVKTKIFYSFRALKGSGGSSGDGSRTISVKNLSSEVTHNILYDFFRDPGGISDLRITQDAQSGLGSAYVEFESGHAARKAVQKSGKNLEGRVILCDIAYEKSGGTQSAPDVDSGHGVRHQPAISRSGSASLTGRVLESQSALRLFDPKVQEGDAKFLSRFNGHFNLNSFDDLSPPPGGYPELVNSAVKSSKSFESRGNRGMVRVPWSECYGSSFPKSGQTQEELEHSDCINEQNLEMQEHSKKTGKRAWPWRGPWSSRRWQRKGKWTALFLAWRRPRWQWWHFAKDSTKWARGKPGSCSRPKVGRTRKNLTTAKESSKSVRVWC